MLAYKVVAGDGNVDVAKWRVGVAEGNHRDVDVGCLRHSLWSNHKTMTESTYCIYMTSESYHAGCALYGVLSEVYRILYIPGGRWMGQSQREGVAREKPSGSDW